jgi:nitrate/nitrite transport system permease protein
VFSNAPAAAIYTIFICSIWPMMINTAIGVQRIPADYLNVARVLDLSTWKVFTKILLPSVMPYLMTGVRLSVGTAWLVIVAAEMLTGGTGIGFWLWNEWNSLNLAHILIAILVIGATGMALEGLLMLLARRFSYGDAR